MNSNIAFKFGNKIFTHNDVIRLSFNPYDLYIVIHQQFNHETNPEKAIDDIAKTFEQFGPVLFNVRLWRSQSKFRTFLDCFEIFENTPAGSFLLKAFERRGFKYWDQCNAVDIRRARIEANRRMKRLGQK